MEELRIPRDGPVCFAQLQGVAEHLGLALGERLGDNGDKWGQMGANGGKWGRGEGGVVPKGSRCPQLSPQPQGGGFGMVNRGGFGGFCAPPNGSMRDICVPPPPSLGLGTWF